MRVPIVMWWGAITIIGAGLVLSVVIGVIVGQRSLWIFGGTGFAPLFAAIAVGWAVDRKLPTTIPGLERIQAMRGFFLLAAVTCLALALVRAL